MAGATQQLNTTIPTLPAQAFRPNATLGDLFNKQELGLLKPFQSASSSLDYLVGREYRYGYTVFFRTNLCLTNIDDVKQLATIAHENGISIALPSTKTLMIERGTSSIFIKTTRTFVPKTLSWWMTLSTRGPTNSARIGGRSIRFLVCRR